MHPYVTDKLLHAHMGSVLPCTRYEESAGTIMVLWWSDNLTCIPSGNLFCKPVANHCGHPLKK